MRRSNLPYRFRTCPGRAISVEFRFNPGKRISTGCYDMPSAVLWAEKYLRDMGMVSDADVPLFHDFAKDFYKRRDPSSFYAREAAFGRVYSDQYLRRQQARLDNYILPAFGSYIPTMITRQMIERWLVSFKPINGRETLSNNTRNKCLIALRQIFDDVKRQGLRVDNPAADVKLMVDKSNPREALPDEAMAVLFPADLEERIKVWGGLMWAVYFSIFYDTGMRPGEIAALRVCDIYKTPHGLAVATRREVNRDAGAILERVKTSGKGYEKRGGLLYHDTADLLLRYIEENNLGGEDLLFTAPERADGLLMTSTSNKRLKTVLEKYGYYEKGRVQYCLRHNYETDRKGDLSDADLAVSMGHTKLRDDYDHQQERDLVRKLESVRDDLFKNRGRKGRESDIVPLDEVLRKKREP